MQAFSITDLLVYVVSLSIEVYSQQGAVFVVGFWLAFLRFIAKFYYSYLTHRMFNPFVYQPLYSQQITNMEYVIILCLRVYFSSALTNSIYFSKRVFGRLNCFRRLKEMSDGLGSVTTREAFNGDLWLLSGHRPREIDLVVFYVISPLGKISNYIYQEYLMILLVNLIDQGFSNPLVYVPAINEGSTYNTLIGSYSKAALCQVPIVMIAESTGARLCLQMLTKLAITPMPDLVMLISPITKLSVEPVVHTDFITYEVIKQWFTKYAHQCKQDNLDPNTDLTLLGVPRQGFLVSYGSEEYAAVQIKELINDLEGLGAPVQTVEQNGRLHLWNLTSFYGERLVDHRESSIHLLSTVISRKVLNNTPQFKIPANVVRVDDTYV